MTYDVTVRIPVEFDSAAEMAGWLERTVVNKMEEQNWSGGCVVIFRSENNQMMMFQDGQGIRQGGFILPHDLYQMDDREDEPYVSFRGLDDADEIEDEDRFTNEGGRVDAPTKREES